MASDLITYLMEERVTEQEQAHAVQLEQERAAARAALEQERAAAQAALEQDRLALTQMVEDALIARFPNAPLSLVTALRQVRDRHGLIALHAAVLRAPDQVSVERLLQAP